MRWKSWIVAALCLVGCVRHDNLSERRPNVLLISIDTLSALHMGVYGYRRATTPYISELARESVVFENVSSQSVHTTASHYSLFTGLYPQHHKVIAEYDRAGYVANLPPLNAELKTLTERLKAAGYHTHWWATAHDDELDLARGLGRGFDSVTHIDLNGAPFAENRARLLEKIKTVGPTPFFAFVHTYIVHAPYCAGSAFAREFNPSYKPRRAQDCRALETRAQAKFGVSTPSPPQRREVFAEDLDLSQPEAQVESEALYDGGIRVADEMVQDIVRALKSSGQWDNTVLILTADHGEAFNEHGEYQHVSAYRENLRIPLILKIPGVAAKRIAEEALSIDIVPTLLDYLSLERSHLDGASLRDSIEGRPRARRGWRYALAANSSAIWDDYWKLVLPASGEYKLYDRRVDPLETKNVAELEPQVLERLRLALDTAISERFVTKSGRSSSRPKVDD